MKNLTLGTLIACLALGLFAIPSWAQHHYKDIDTPPLPEFDIPEAERVEFGNGMIVFLIENHELPLVEMSARVGIGSIYEPSGKVGLASITGEVMRSGGTKTTGPDELNERLESMGAQIETFIGSVSGQAFMSTLTENVDEVLPLFVDVIQHPAFPEDKIDLAKTQEKSFIARRNDNAQSILAREFDKLLYGADSPYARHTEYATIDAVERQDLIDFHASFFHPNNTILGVWGDFDTEEMTAKLEDAFSTWERMEGFVRPPQPSVDTASEGGVYYAPKMDVTQSSVMMGHPGEIKMDHPDYFAVTVMNGVLSGFTGRLFQNVRDDKGLAYSVFGGYSANFERPGEFYAGIMTKSESTVEGAQAVREEIVKLREEAPSQEELDLAKDNYLNSFVFNFDTRREIVNRMMTYEYYEYPLDFLNQVMEGVKSVGPEDVHRVARTYLRPDEMSILAVGNDEDFGEPLSALGKVETIDIAIPTGEEPEPEATEETLSEGRDLLMKALDTVGGLEAFQAVETMRSRMVTQMTTPDGQQMSTTVSVLVRYPSDMRLEQSMMGQSITIVISGNEVVMQMPGGVTQTAPPQVRDMVLAEMKRNIVSLFAQADDEALAVQHVGQDEVDGNVVEALHISSPDNSEGFRLLIDSETNEPVALAHTGPNPFTGTPTQTRHVFLEMKQFGDIRLPTRTALYQDGNPAGEATIEEIEINLNLPDHFFSLE